MSFNSTHFWYHIFVKKAILSLLCKMFMNISLIYWNGVEIHDLPILFFVIIFLWFANMSLLLFRLFPVFLDCHYWWHESENESEVAQSCPTLCDPMDCSLSGSSVHGIFQAIVLEWIAISFSRGTSWPMDWTQVSRIVDRCFTVWATRVNFMFQCMGTKNQ